MLIGNLGDLQRHPLWDLRPPLNRDGRSSVVVCLGSDDPLTFATTLREEYQLIEDTLVLAGLKVKDGREWLNYARAAGLRERFTLSGVIRDVNSVFLQSGSRLDLLP